MALPLSHDMFGDPVRLTRFSPCRKYRYFLQITWDENKPALVFLMLNPSTADEKANDSTVELCERRARKMGFGSVIILNLFAYRATEPSDMKKYINPVGIDNDLVIEATVRAVVASGGSIICAWGNHGAHQDRAKRVVAKLKAMGADLMALKLNTNGHPAHPLYLKYEDQPKPWDGEIK